MNIYILNYNPLEIKISSNQLATFITDNRKIYQWYIPFAGTYVIKSNDTLASLAESFRGVFDGAPFILSHTFPVTMGGAQNDVVWNWINNHNFSNQNQSYLSEASK